VVSDVREMKDSGVEWIGRIPESWQVLRGKYLFSESHKKGGSDLTLLSPTQAYGVIPQSNLDGVVHVKKDTDLRMFKTVKTDDFIISLRSFQGGFEWSHMSGVCTPAYTVFNTTSTDVHPAYFARLFKCTPFIEKLNNITRGIREGKNISYGDFANTLLPLPPLEEQELISEYLDKRCAAIDEVKRTITDEIDALQRLRKATIHRAVTKGLDADVPMRDSGVEWIGEIPAGWDLLRFKYVATVVPNLRDPRQYEKFHQVSPEDIEKDTGKLITRKTVEQAGFTSVNHLFHQGQIVYSKIRPALNKAITAPFDGLCSADMYPIETKQCTEWLLYFMLSQAFVNQIVVSAGRVKMPKVNQNELDRFIVVLPPLPEQQRIADYLDERCAAIDSVIETRTKQLERLEDYRKALIFAYVTGKKEVPKAKPKDGVGIL